MEKVGERYISNVINQGMSSRILRGFHFSLLALAEGGGGGSVGGFPEL